MYGKHINRVSCGKLPYVYDFEADVDVDDEYLDDSEDKLDVVGITESIQSIRYNVDFSSDRISRIESNTENLKTDLSRIKNELESSIFLTKWIVFGVGVLMVVFFIALAG